MVDDLLLEGGEVVWPVRHLESVPVLDSRPVRRFTWRARQRHCPGLQFMVSTGRHHGFESLEEQRLLLALDFLTVVEVLPQPFRLDFEHRGGAASIQRDAAGSPPSRRANPPAGLASINPTFTPGTPCPCSPPTSPPSSKNCSTC
ncbi:hypothetical protein AB0D46_32450 [Streptomyces sp. NPDC048383]|uniref:hypothetical protein n=1 Tax=Streptomyces sp. NPDC048383 TaxID=3155386 RepID=UPI003433C45D